MKEVKTLAEDQVTGLVLEGIVGKRVSWPARVWDNFWSRLHPNQELSLELSLPWLEFEPTGKDKGVRIILGQGIFEKGIPLPPPYQFKAGSHRLRITKHGPFRVKYRIKFTGGEFFPTGGEK